MATAINVKTISSQTDQYLVLSSAQAGRLMRIGTNWNSIRILLHHTFADFGANVTGTPNWYIGLTSGTPAANGPLYSTTTNFVGVLSTSATWTRAITPVRYSVAVSVATKVGAVVSSAASTTGNIGADTAVRSITGVQITKGSPFSVQAILHSATTTFNDVTLSAAIAAAEQDTLANAATSLGNHQAGTATNRTVDESTNGFLDTIIFAWDRTAPELQVSSIIYSKRS